MFQFKPTSGIICVFHLKEAVDVFLRCAVLYTGVGILPHHVIDRVHDVGHLLDTKQ